MQVLQVLQILQVLQVIHVIHVIQVIQVIDVRNFLLCQKLINSNEQYAREERISYSGRNKFEKL
jgi:hypothetical protein